MLTADDLVTGEAVALDLPPATVGARMASGLIDVAVTLVLVLVAVFLVFVVAALHADGALRARGVGLHLVVVFLVYPTTVETLTRGKSLGKLASACGTSATTAARSPSSTRSSGR